MGLVLCQLCTVGNVSRQVETDGLQVVSAVPRFCDPSPLFDEIKGVVVLWLRSGRVARVCNIRDNRPWSVGYIVPWLALCCPVPLLFSVKVDWSFQSGKRKGIVKTATITAGLLSLEYQVISVPIYWLCESAANYIRYRNLTVNSLLHPSPSCTLRAFTWV